MQTFLPENAYHECASALDNKRLNKQILEAYQILNVLSGNSPTGGWRNHPAVLMWKDYEYSLAVYAMSMIDEAEKRNIKVDKNKENIQNLVKKFGDSWGRGTPFWFNKKDLDKIRMTHKANLYIKDPTYYFKYAYAVNDPLNKPCCDTCKYYWVTHDRRNND